MSITTNTDGKNNHDNSNNTETEKMEAPTTSIKVKLGDSCRYVQLPANTMTIAALVAAVRSAFQLTDNDAAAQEISLTYRDRDGDDITFDKNSELALALRLCPSPLEVTAALRLNDTRTKVGQKKTNNDPDKIYQVAARRLHEVHGITSINAKKLEEVLSLLKLRPRRLVRQGLAPRPLLRVVKDVEKQKREKGAKAGSSTPPIATEAVNKEVIDAVAVEWEMLNVDGDAAEAEDKHQDGEAAAKDVVGAECARKEVSAKDNKGKPDIGSACIVKPNLAARMPIYAALVAGGIKIRPRETRPLLHALGVRPMRLVRLGLVDRAALAAVLTSRHGRGKIYKLHGPGGAGIPEKRGDGRCRRGRMHGVEVPGARVFGDGSAGGAGTSPPPPPQQQPQVVVCHGLGDGHAGWGMMHRPDHSRHAFNQGMHKGGERQGRRRDVSACGDGYARGGGGRRGSVRGNGGRVGRGSQATPGGDKPCA